MAKVTELINNPGHVTYSFEVTPDISEEELDKLDKDPTFFSITWHAKSHQCENMDIAPLRAANLLINKGKRILLHLSCDMTTTDYLILLLETLREKNICNLFVILGENYNSETSDFKNTSHLIKFIREKTGNYFCIGVAGFPDCSNEKLLHLKEKVASGADFIITQAFFDTGIFRTFTDRCRQNNINVPILPGVFPFESFKQLTHFINLCKIKVSNNLLQYVNNKETCNQTSQVVKQLIQDLNLHCTVTHFHFYTLNKMQRINEFCTLYLPI